MSEPYVDRWSKIFPHDSFENEPGPPAPLDMFTRPEDIAEIRARNDRIMREILARGAKRKVGGSDFLFTSALSASAYPMAGQTGGITMKVLTAILALSPDRFKDFWR